MRLINPFAPLTGKQRDAALQEALAKRAAQARIDALTTAYKALLEDTRYTAIRDEARQLMGSALTDLVEQACRCEHGCAPKALHVRMLHQLHNEALEHVWFEEHRAQEESLPEEFA